MNIDDVTVYSSTPLASTTRSPAPAFSEPGLPLPGEVWKLKDSRTLVEVQDVIKSEQFETYVRGYELEGPARARTKRCFRAITVSKLDCRVPMEESDGVS